MNFRNRTLGLWQFSFPPTPRPILSPFSGERRETTNQKCEIARGKSGVLLSNRRVDESRQPRYFERSFWRVAFTADRIPMPNRTIAPAAIQCGVHASGARYKPGRRSGCESGSVDSERHTISSLSKSRLRANSRLKRIPVRPTPCERAMCGCSCLQRRIGGSGYSSFALRRIEELWLGSFCSGK